MIIEAANIIDIFRGIAEGFGTLASIQQERAQGGYGPDYEMDAQDDYYKPQNPMVNQPYYPAQQGNGPRADYDMGRQAQSPMDDRSHHGSPRLRLSVWREVTYIAGNRAISAILVARPLALRPCLTTGLPLDR